MRYDDESRQEWEDTPQDGTEQVALPFGEAGAQPTLQETTPAPAVSVTPSTGERCESCGGAAVAGDLCARCHTAFHGVEQPRPAPRPEHTIPSKQFDELFAALEEASAKAAITTHQQPIEEALSAKPSVAPMPVEPQVEASHVASHADAPAFAAPAPAAATGAVASLEVTESSARPDPIVASTIETIELPRFEAPEFDAPAFEHPAMPIVSIEPARIAISTIEAPAVESHRLESHDVDSQHFEAQVQAAAQAQPIDEMMVAQAFEPPTIRMPKFDTPAFDSAGFGAGSFEAPKPPAAAPAPLESTTHDTHADEVPQMEAPQLPQPQFDAPPLHAQKSDVQKSDALKIEVKKIEVKKVEVPKAAVPEPAPALEHPEVVVAASAPVPVVAERRRYVGVIAAGLVIGAIGVPLGRLWLGSSTADVSAAPVTNAAPASTSDAPLTLPKISPVEHLVADEPAPVTPAASGSPAAPVKSPTPSAARRNTRATPTARPAKPMPTPAIAANIPAVESTAIVVPAASEVVAVPPPPPPVVETPVGPFFETTQVERTPQVISRIEPQVPDALQGTALREIVVVRVLVSQTGRPVLVSLLRRAKAGKALDDAVIAAVKKWTFEPAVKRGQAVSCYTHIGVAIGATR